MPSINLDIRRIFNLGALIFVSCSLVLLAFPQTLHAEKQCPANLTPQTSVFNNAIGCYQGDERKGYAVDPADYPPCPTNGDIPLYDGVSVTGGVNCVNADGQSSGPNSAIAPKGIDQSTSCFWNFDFTRCFWDPSLKLIGTLLMTLSAYILLLAGTVFDWFLKLMVLQFSGTFSAVIVGIKIGWQLFRDLMNIAIIGIFVFVAIMTILGSAEYGAKRLIANALVIAVLINFSFLFTNIAIDGTNFISNKFWEAMSQEIQDKGTAQTFLKAFGISDYWKDSSKLVQNASTAGGGSWAGLLYGLVGGVMLITIALVLLYGAFVITARALLLLFAMLTSSLAFASFMLPNKTANIPYVGWNAWWSNMLKAAAFGPFLILFLWITMKIIETANPKGAGSALATLANNPKDLTPDIWGQLIILIIGTGMLFIAIRAAGSFSSSIGGFNLAGALAASPFAALSRYGIAPTLRNLPWVGGRGGAKRALDLEERIDAEKMERARARLAGQPYNNASLARLFRQKDSAEKQAKSTYDLMNSKAGQTLGKMAGLSTIFTDKVKTNFAETAKARADVAAKKASETTVSAEDARDNVLKRRQEHHEDLKAQHETAAGMVRAVKDAAAETKRAERIEEKHTAAKERAAEIEKEVSKNKMTIQGDASLTQDQRRQQIAAEDAKIQKAREEVREEIKVYQDRINALDQPAAEAERELKGKHEQIKRFEADVNAEVEGIVKASKENAGNVVGAITRNSFSGLLSKVIEATPNDVVTRMARGAVKKKIKVKGVKLSEEARRQALADAGENEPPAAAGAGH